MNFFRSRKDLTELLEGESDEFVLNHERDKNDAGVISLKSDLTIKVQNKARDNWLINFVETIETYVRKTMIDVIRCVVKLINNSTLMNASIFDRGGPIAVKTRSYGALALPEACLEICLEAWSLCFFACGVRWVKFPCFVILDFGSVLSVGSHGWRQSVDTKVGRSLIRPRAFIEADEAKELLKPLTEPGNKFTKICYSNRSFGLDAAQVAACILFSINRQLSEVDLSDFIAGRPEAEALEGIAISQIVNDSPMLEDFLCSSTRVGSEGGLALAEALGTCNNMKKLDIRDNMFGVEAGIALSQSIPVFVNLTEISLSYLHFEDEGTLALVNSLKNSESALEVLEMAGNNYTYKVAPTLAACITSKKSTLTKLILSENELKDEGAIVIANGIKDGFDRLIEVDLSINDIRTAGASVLSQAVVGKPGFKLLNIDGNFLSDEGVDHVRDIFKNFLSVLGPLDENEPEGEDYDDDENDNNWATRCRS
ncbi:leucine-rich repeat, ribonuclease inhibitor subtype protein [Tanacetum coccineum]